MQPIKVTLILAVTALFGSVVLAQSSSNEPQPNAVALQSMPAGGSSSSGGGKTPKPMGGNVSSTVAVDLAAAAAGLAFRCPIPCRNSPSVERPNKPRRGTTDAPPGAPRTRRTSCATTGGVCCSRWQ